MSKKNVVLLAVLGVLCLIFAVAGCAFRSEIRELMLREGNGALSAGDKERLGAYVAEYVTEHQEEIEADMREVYDEWEDLHNTWEKYKGSADGEEFDRAVDAWENMEDGLDFVPAMSRSFHLRYEEVKWNRAFHAVIDRIGLRYVNADIDDIARKAVNEVFWGEGVPVTDLPKEIPYLVLSEDFPQYKGSARAIEDAAKGFYERADDASKYWTEGSWEVQAKKYADFVVENEEVLRRRGFFDEYPSEDEMAIVQAKKYYGEFRNADSQGDVMKYAAIYNDYVSRKEQILREDGFFEEYPEEIRFPEGSVS